MKIDDKLLQQATSDLGINLRFEKGRTIPVKNCWHFSTDGNKVDSIFEDTCDFQSGMNRIYILALKYHIIILAFCLMDNHIHFLLWGDFDACNRFMHDFVRRTSISLSIRHTGRRQMEKIPINHQVVEDDSYLKTVICYIIKNPPVAGLPYTSYDYPWSSGSLYFRNDNLWTSPSWMNKENFVRLSEMTWEEKYAAFRTHPFNNGEGRFMPKTNIVFPGDYVAYELVEAIFRTQKSFNYFMSKSKESDVDSVNSFISNLTIPDQEMKQHRDEICKELFGSDSIRKLDTTQRLRLAKTLRSRYFSSKKQVIRLSGLKYDEVFRLL